MDGKNNPTLALSHWQVPTLLLRSFVFRQCHPAVYHEAILHTSHRRGW